MRNYLLGRLMTQKQVPEDLLRKTIKLIAKTQAWSATCRKFSQDA